MTMPDLHPDGFARLPMLLDALARFSAPGAGVTRLVYDEHWCEAQVWVRAQARALGLQATADAAGNLYLHSESVQPGAEVVLVGSHLDTVRHGGAYDGGYGAMAGLLLAAAHAGQPGTPVVGFITCEEEQSRFDSHMMGARSMLGIVEDAELDSVRDGEGVTWRQALQAIRASGHAAAPVAGGLCAPLFTPRAQFELHIEQGPVLESAGEAIGVVAHIAGYRRLRATLTGAPRHSGTTPLAARRDALAGAAEVILAAEALARASGEPARVSCGRVIAAPGLYNVVAGRSELALEVRHDRVEQLDALEAALLDHCDTIAMRRALAFTHERVAEQAPTALSPALVRMAAALANEHGVAHRIMTSGAAHDTMEFARAGIPALMLFVPSRDGISHSPDEFTGAAQLQAGVCFASDLLTRITAGGAW